MVLKAAGVSDSARNCRTRKPGSTPT